MAIEIGPDLDWTPCTYETCEHVSGPFYHGTAAALEPGTLLSPGFESNFQPPTTSTSPRCLRRRPVWLPSLRWR